MNKDKWGSSDWIALAVLLLIPLSWFVKPLISMVVLNHLLRQGIDFQVEDLAAMAIFTVEIPLIQLVTLATVVIPVIFARKAAREATTNLTFPTGQNGTEKPLEETQGK